MGLDLGRSHVVLDGQFVNNKVANIATALAEYEPELAIEHYPEADGIDLAKYAVIHDSPNLGKYVLFYVMDDDHMDERVVARVIQNDQRRGQAKLTELEAWEQAQQMLKRQEFLDKMEEANDIAKHVFKTHKNDYTFRNPNTGKIVHIKE